MHWTLFSVPKCLLNLWKVLSMFEYFKPIVKPIWVWCREGNAHALALSSGKKTTNKTINKLHELKQSNKYDSNYLKVYFSFTNPLAGVVEALKGCSVLTTSYRPNWTEQVKYSVVHLIICDIVVIAVIIVLIHLSFHIFISSIIIFLIPDLFKSFAFNHNNPSDCSIVVGIVQWI